MKWLALGVVMAACSSSSAPTPSPSGSAGSAVAGSTAGSGSAARPPSPFEAFDTTFPKVGDQAPDFTLTDSAGKQLKLSDATSRGPVVLVWGSFT